jgi:hypothetical protein
MWNLICSILQSIVIVFVGQTGLGKSETCKQFYRLLSGLDDSPFEPSAGIQSHTQQCFYSKPHQHIVLVDTPGLLDSGGIADSDQTGSIVNFLQMLPKVHLIVLVRRHASNRFDSNLQKMLQLCYNSFGSQCVGNMAFLYTVCIEPNDLEKVRGLTAQFMEAFCILASISPQLDVPTFGIDFLWEVPQSVIEFFNLDVNRTQEMKEKMKDDSEKQIEQLIDLSKSLEPLKTKSFVNLQKVCRK